MTNSVYESGQEVKAQSDNNTWYCIVFGFAIPYESTRDSKLFAPICSYSNY